MGSRQRDGVKSCRNEFAWSVLVTKAAVFVNYAMVIISSYQMSGKNQMVNEDAKLACPNAVSNVAKRNREVHILICNGAWRRGPLLAVVAIGSVAVDARRKRCTKISSQACGNWQMVRLIFAVKSARLAGARKVCGFAITKGARYKNQLPNSVW